MIYIYLLYFIQDRFGWLPLISPEFVSVDVPAKNRINSITSCYEQTLPQLPAHSPIDESTTTFPRSSPAMDHKVATTGRKSVLESAAGFESPGSRKEIVTPIPAPKRIYSEEDSQSWRDFKRDGLLNSEFSSGASKAG